MVRLLSVIAVLCFGWVSTAHAEFSSGCRMGEVVKFSVKGWVNKSGEGQMSIGQDGSPFAYTSRDSEGNTKTRTLNPWSFSATPETWDGINTSLGEPVVVCYSQAQFNSGIYQDTDYTVTSVTPIAPDTPKPDLSACTIPKPDTSWHNGGTRVGRIVKASNKGTFIKSYEVIVQEGNAGNNYFEMSISDEKIFNCAMMALKSGRKLKISYVEYVWSLGRDTNYDIYGLTLAGSLPE